MNEELKIIIKAQTEQAQKNIKAAKEEVEKLGDEGKQSSGKFKSAMTAVGNAAKAAGQAVGAAMKAVGAAFVAAGAAMVGLAESTREYRTEQAKLTTAFEAAGASAEDATKTYNGLYRVLGDSGQATEAASHIAQLTQNEQEMAQWTDICQGVYATFGDSLPIESLTEAANETAKVGTVTGSLADALNWAGISEDDFNAKLEACNSEAEREALIRSTLNGVYDEASKGYEENAASILAANEAQAKLTSGLAALGAAVEPVITIFKGFLGDVLQEMAPHLETVSQGLQDIMNGVDGGAEKLSEGISGALGAAMDAITKILPTLITVGVEIILSLVEGITKALPDIIAAVVDMIPKIIDGLMAALPALISGVAQLVIGLANALPEIMTSITDALPTVIESIVNALPEMIPALLDGIVQAISILLGSIGDILQPIIDALPDIIISIVEAIMTNLPVLIEGLISLILAIVQAIPQIIDGLVKALPTIIALIVEGLLSCVPQLIVGWIQVIAGVVVALPQIFGSLIEGIGAIFVGIWNGIVNTFSKVGTWFAEKFQAAKNAIKEKFEPIKETFTNVWNKVKETFSNVKGWFKEKFQEAWNAVKGVFSSVGSFFGGIWNTIKQKFTDIGQKIGSAVSGAFKKAVNSVLGTATKIINGFINAINWAIDVINKIPGVNIGKLSTLDVPQMARGGIVDSATLAVVGEQGKEAVVPLENNLGWLDKLAGMLNDRMGGTSGPIVLQVDGKTFAQVTCGEINKLTRQTGSLPLVIA